jgi:hypothetical protein
MSEIGAQLAQLIAGVDDLRVAARRDDTYRAAIVAAIAQHISQLG